MNRFLERVYHPDRLTTPLRRSGPKGDGRFEPVSWDDALGEIASRFSTLIGTVGSESILQFSFDGTQGVIQKGILVDRSSTRSVRQTFIVICVGRRRG